jgi:MoxR-like ATPase
MKANKVSETRAQEARGKINGLVKALGRYLVGRDEAIRLLALATAAGEPMLLLGPPGTAKSDLIFKFAQAIGVGADDYFEYMITAFTEPSEIVGPVDIKALREDGVYRRRLEGRLADAKVVFLDEIFNGNSAILNTLLTVMNERKVYDAGKPRRLDKLIGFFAATNQIPEREELGALKDRFVIKVKLDPVQQDDFDGLIAAGLRNERCRATGQTPWVTGDVTPEDFAAVRDYVAEVCQADGSDFPRFPEGVHRTFRRIVLDLDSQGVSLSDREVIKLYRLIVLHGYLFHGRLPGSIQLADLVVMRYVAESAAQFAVVRKCVDDAIGGAGA